MRVFVTGASGWIGSAVVPELHRRGPSGRRARPLGRLRRRARRRRGRGAPRRARRPRQPARRRGRRPTASSTWRSSTTFSGDFAAAAAADLRAIETLGAALEGSDRPLVITSGAGRAARRAHRDRARRARPPAVGRVAPDRAPRTRRSRSPRAASARRSCGSRRRSTAKGDHGFVAILIGIARDKGVSGYVGDGANRWPAVHRLDAARLFRLALESAPAGSVLHAVADEGVPMRDDRRGHRPPSRPPGGAIRSTTRRALRLAGRLLRPPTSRPRAR